MPKVSVLIPCYNGGQFLKPAIESVLKQDLSDWELIIVDNCSEDDSFAVARDYASQDRRIKAFQNQTNLGMVGNWNRACELATGEYVKILCADDILRAECLSIQSRQLDQHPSAILSSGGSVVINASGQSLLRRYPVRNFGTEADLLVSASNVIRALIAAAANLIGEPSLTMFRRSAMQRAGTFDESYRYGTDLEYWLRLLVQGAGDLVLTKNTLAEYRVHPGGLTNQQMLRGQEELVRMFKTYSTAYSDICFDEDLFQRKYQRQSLAKKQVLRFANRFWATPVFRILDQLRSAFS
jgi:glycosyltransferase involved in cell wall biosynthesis